MTIEEYTEALRRHDWSFQYSDDHGVWRRGTQSLRQLEAAQPVLDPNFEIWNQCCHPHFCRTAATNT